MVARATAMAMAAGTKPETVAAAARLAARLCGLEEPMSAYEKAVLEIEQWKAKYAKLQAKYTQLVDEVAGLKQRLAELEREADGLQEAVNGYQEADPGDRPPRLGGSQ
jgi:septal ring factor EnvC (AmiA/AmiB activator)